MDTGIEISNITEAIYYLEPVKSSKCKRKRESNDRFSALLDKAFGSSKLESDLRCKLYKEIDTLRNGFNDLVTNFNKPKLEEIVDFISSEGRRCASNTVTQIKEVPAVLVTGDDHILHEQDHGILRRALNILDSMIVACIVEPDNYLSVESLTKSIVKDIIKDWRLKSGRRKKGPKITEELSEALPYTLGTVRRLYTKHSSTVGAFVVFISGLTTTSIPIIGSFISICREYISDIPIVLVFGVATCIETFYNYIPHSAISSLKVKEIQLKSSDEFVDALVEELLIRRTDGLKLGPIMLRHLFYALRAYNKSLEYMLNQWIQVLIEYYYSSPNSLLIHYCDQSREKRESCSSRNVDLLKYWCYPVRTQIEKLAKTDPTLALSLISENDNFLDYVNNCLNELKACNSRLMIGFEFLKVLSSLLLNKTSIETLKLYQDLLEGRLSNDHYFVSEIMNCVDKVTLQTLSACVLGCICVIKRSSDISEFAEISSNLSIIAIKIKFDNQTIQQDELVKSNNAVPSFNLHPSRTSCRANYTKRIIISESVSTGPAAEVSLSDPRVEFKQILRRIFSLSFINPTDCLLYELVYIHNQKLLAKEISTRTLSSIQDFLSEDNLLLALSHVYTPIKGKNKSKKGRVKMNFPVNPGIFTVTKAIKKSGRVCSLGELYSIFMGYTGGGRLLPCEYHYLRSLFITSILELSYVGLLRFTSGKLRMQHT